MTYDQRVVDLLTRRLPQLTHPGDGSGAIMLPVAAFSAANNLPPEVAEHFAEEAGLPHSDVPRLYAEAIIATIEASGRAIVDRAEWERLQAQSQPAEASQQVPIHCHCGVRLFTVQMSSLNTGQPSVYGPTLIKAMRELGTDCATGHRA